MKHLLLTVVALFALYQLFGWIGSLKTGEQEQRLARMVESPPHAITDPFRNGYFHLMGFIASPSLDPAKVGYEIWVETSASSETFRYDYEKPGRADLHIPLSLAQATPWWSSDDPFHSFRQRDTLTTPVVQRYRTLLDRYERLIGMPFEDWGYGRRAIPRVEELLIVHRMFIAEGIARQSSIALDRLYRELLFWRMALRAATTPATKVLAQVVIRDDLDLLARIMAQPTVDKVFIAAGLQLTTPFTGADYALQWPMRHQLALAVHDHRASMSTSLGADENAYHESDRLATLAHLPSNAFQHLDHPVSHSTFGFFGGRPPWDLYAAYYDALLNTPLHGQSTLPTLRDVAGRSQHGWLHGLFAQTTFEPDWEPFLLQLKETDARLRLVSLQIQLRRPSGIAAVPTRLAEVGSQYYDPFTELPMLWSPTQHKIYSVGKDRLDDGGDSSFDIAVSAPIVSSPTVAKLADPSSPTGKRRLHP